MKCKCIVLINLSLELNIKIQEKILITSEKMFAKQPTTHLAHGSVRQKWLLSCHIKMTVINLNSLKAMTQLHYKYINFNSNAAH